jgi:hypothetical protein
LRAGSFELLLELHDPHRRAAEKDFQLIDFATSPRELIVLSASR